MDICFYFWYVLKNNVRLTLCRVNHSGKSQTRKDRISTYFTFVFLFWLMYIKNRIKKICTWNLSNTGSHLFCMTFLTILELSREHVILNTDGPGQGIRVRKSRVTTWEQTFNYKQNFIIMTYHFNCIFHLMVNIILITHY